MRVLRRYMVIRNGTETRLVTGVPKLDANEVAIEINVTVPQPPRLIGVVDLELPEPPQALAAGRVLPYPPEETEVDE